MELLENTPEELECIGGLGLSLPLGGGLDPWSMGADGAGLIGPSLANLALRHSALTAKRRTDSYATREPFSLLMQSNCNLVATKTNNFEA